MTQETAVLATEKAASLKERLELLYLREATVEIRAMVPGSNGSGMVEGTETLHLKAPSARADMEMALDFQERHRDRIEAASGFELDGRDVGDLDPEERGKLLDLMEINLALSVEYVRLSCEELRDADRELIAAIIRGNGGSDGELAGKAAQVCAGQGPAKGGLHDPFASPGRTA